HPAEAEVSANCVVLAQGNLACTVYYLKKVNSFKFSSRFSTCSHLRKNGGLSEGGMGVLRISVAIHKIDIRHVRVVRYAFGSIYRKRFDMRKAQGGLVVPLIILNHFTINPYRASR
ncbi:MAG: hypothetical protein MJ091_06230, partial [Clostridia bacterium]|nr:hypothetical protein [Clostridia bacterium]